MASNEQISVDAVERLSEEYQAWTKFHPEGFHARTANNDDNTTDWFIWDCAIPGPKKTPWEGGLYKLKMFFPKDYPFSPPKCQFVPPIFHPNVFPSGTVCLSLINKERDWKPQTTIREVLTGIQLLLNDPNFKDPAQAEAFAVFSQSKFEYEDRVRKQAVERAVN